MWNDFGLGSYKQLNEGKTSVNRPLNPIVGLEPPENWIDKPEFKYR